MATDLSFESLPEAIEHANFVAHSIECTVGGNVRTVDPEGTTRQAPVSEEATAEASTALATFVDSATAVVHNFNGTPLYQWQLEQKCKGKECLQADDVLGKEMLVKFVYFHPCEVLDGEGGELSTMIRTVIMTPDLSAVGFVSMGVAQSMMQLHRLFDGKPFDPPVKVKIEQKNTRHGRRVYIVEPIME